MVDEDTIADIEENLADLRPRLVVAAARLGHYARDGMQLGPDVAASTAHTISQAVALMDEMIDELRGAVDTDEEIERLRAARTETLRTAMEYRRERNEFCEEAQRLFDLLQEAVNDRQSQDKR